MLLSVRLQTLQGAHNRSLMYRKIQDGLLVFDHPHTLVTYDGLGKTEVWTNADTGTPKPRLVTALIHLIFPVQCNSHCCSF